jgi:hypothetical protein
VRNISKCTALILILVIALSSLSLLMVKPADAQTSKPSVPEFSLKLIDFSGAKAIELSIKNQPFESNQGNGQTISLYYNVHFKLHNSDSWTALYYCGDVFPTHSNSDYIKLDYPMTLTSPGSSSYYLLKEKAGNYYMLSQISSNDQIDFRVQAMEGYLTSASFTGQTSSWSNIQTITIPATASSPDPTPTPTVPEFQTLIILPLFVVLLIAASIIKLKNPNITSL